MAFAFNSIQKLEDVILNPFVTGPLLLVLTNGPTVIREPLLSQLVALINRQNVKRLILGLKWALALGLVQKINSWLNAVALTNWQVRPAKDKWVWDSEIAVVTGGSSGIGAEIVKCLVRKGVQVAVLDIQPVPKDMDGRKL
jgi:all-trans-retinol dehydrogenase (NAD+)